MNAHRTGGAVIRFDNSLVLSRCPACSVSHPSLTVVFETTTADHSGGNQRLWKVYRCSHCGGLVTAFALHGRKQEVADYFPQSSGVADAVPEPARTYLSQAVESLHAPAGAVMLCASAIDAMLKKKGLRKGHLYPRIEEAKDQNLITEEMAAWAHNIRLDANEPRHADEAAPLPTEEDARRCVDFAEALADLIFVLPARVLRGRTMAEAKPKNS